MTSTYERRRRFIQRWQLSATEQTCDLLQHAETDPEGAAYELAVSRSSRRRQTTHGDEAGGGTAKEARIAEEISRFVAREASPVVETLREQILGSRAPLSCVQALELLASNTVESGGRAISFADDLSVEHHYHLDPNSNLARLVVPTHLLGEVCHWREAETTRFLLMGEVPMIPAIRVETHRMGHEGPFRCPIVVTLLPHVSDKTVVKMIKRARRRLVGASKGPIPELRRQAMTDFVQTLNHRQQWQGWPDAHRQWSRIAPSTWRFSSWRAMERAHEHEEAARARVRNSGTSPALQSRKSPKSRSIRRRRRIGAKTK